MAFRKFNARKPVRLRLLSPLGFYPKTSVLIPGGHLIVRDNLIVSAVRLAAPQTHGVTSEHSSELEFLALEEIRFLAAVALAVHPDNGMAYAYPVFDHADVPVGLDENALLTAAEEQLAPALEPKRLNTGETLPPCFGGPAYTWREAGVDTGRVLKIVSNTQLRDHLLIRGLGSLLRSTMCWQHREIGEAALMQLYVALDASFQIMLRTLKEQGISNPSAKDAGDLIDQIFNPGIDSGTYFQDYYEDRIKVSHPSSQFGIFPFVPLAADNYYFLRHGLVEVYHWLITREKLMPE